MAGRPKSVQPFFLKVLSIYTTIYSEATLGLRQVEKTNYPYEGSHHFRGLLCVCRQYESISISGIGVCCYCFCVCNFRRKTTPDIRANIVRAPNTIRDLRILELPIYGTRARVQTLHPGFTTQNCILLIWFALLALQLPI